MMCAQARARMRTAWGWSQPRVMALAYRSAAQALARRESPAKSHRASCSCLSAPQRKVTALVLPDWRVEGATPARQGRESRGGNRPRAAPILAGRRAARMLPERGSEVKTAASGWAASWVSIVGGQGGDLCVEHAQNRDERGGGDRVSGCVFAGGAAGCGQQPGVQHAGVDPAAVGRVAQ